jgi:hypothetical protein
MSNRLIHFALLAIAVSTTGSTLAALSHGLPVPSSPAATELPVTLMPTIVVHPEPVIPTLGTITVVPDRADRTSSGDDYSLSEAIRGAGASAVGSLPGGAFAMPYYSFGRSLRRAAKE